MNWILVLLAGFVVLGLMRPGRLGSTYVAILVLAASVMTWAYLRLGT